MSMDIKQYSDSEIQIALGVAICELGFGSRVKDRSPHDFSAVRPREVHLTLAESPDVEKHAAWFSPLLEEGRAEETLLDRSAAYAVERQAGWSCLDENIREA